MFNLKAEFYLKIIFLFSFIALISAFFIEYILGHQPCNLCLIERIPYGLSIMIIMVIFLIKKNQKFLILLLIAVIIFFLSKKIGTIVKTRMMQAEIKRKVFNSFFFTTLTILSISVYVAQREL